LVHRGIFALTVDEGSDTLPGQTTDVAADAGGGERGEQTMSACPFILNYNTTQVEIPFPLLAKEAI
jgi:hypothetical protein